ncbi:hypothetical protein VPH35_030417 [Triticum aestivum]
MGFFNGKTKQTTTHSQKPERRVKVRVEPPGYSHHEFELPASHLRSRHFASLMAKAKKERGVEGEVVAIPCALEDFLVPMVKTISRAPFDSSPRCPILSWFSARSR